MAMTAKRRTFCQYVVEGLNGKESAIKAGYSENNAKVQASQLLASEEIQDYIAELKELQAKHKDSPPVLEDVSIALACKDPIQKLVELMNCGDMLIEQSSAKALLPYFYLKKHEQQATEQLGKKELKEAQAIEATSVSKFATLSNQLSR